MNRAQRRKLDKKTGLKGLGKFMDHIHNNDAPRVPDGAKVRIRYEQIMKRSDYASKTPAYRAFVESLRAQDPVFTAVRPQAGKALVELQEDPTEPKWLWWDGDLELVKEEA